MAGKSLFDNKTFTIMGIRHCIVTIHGFAFAEAQFYLPLTIIHTIYCAGPLAIFVMDYFINKVSITGRQLVAALIAFFGVLLTINGELIKNQLFGDSEFESDFNNYKTDSITIKILVGLGMVVLQTMQGYGLLLVKKLRNLHHSEVNFNFGVWMMGIGSVLFPYHSISMSE